MRTWERVAYLEHCGGCGAILEKDAPMQRIEIHGLKRKLIRGQCCAGNAPPDLPARIEIAGIEERVKQLASVAPKTRGELKRMAREWMPFREPGSDDE